MSLEERLNALEAKVAELDGQQDAIEQALANREKIRELDERLEVTVRGLNAIACLLTGALLLWFGNPLINDVSIANDRIGEGLFVGGGICIAYGLLVLTGNEGKALAWLDTINPWRK